MLVQRFLEVWEVDQERILDRIWSCLPLAQELLGLHQTASPRALEPPVPPHAEISRSVLATTWSGSKKKKYLKRQRERVAARTEGEMPSIAVSSVRELTSSAGEGGLGLSFA